MAEEHPLSPFNLAGIALLETFRRDNVKDESRPDHVKVHASELPGQGLRIYEVSCVSGKTGASWMRCDPACCGFILACEDFILDHKEEPFRPEGWDSDIDLADDARCKLLDLLNKE